jgi:hypothetical protein
VDAAFDGSIDYAQLVKSTGDAPESAKGRYSPAECTGATKTPVFGIPANEHISTSFVERPFAPLREDVPNEWRPWLTTPFFVVGERGAQGKGAGHGGTDAQQRVFMPPGYYCGANAPGAGEGSWR